MTVFEAGRATEPHRANGRIIFSVPGARHYEIRGYANRSSSWGNISVTGNHCSRGCEHCRGHMLERMTPARTPEHMREIIDRLAVAGCRGVLVSGGADVSGRVPLEPFFDSLDYAKQAGLLVAVHTGLVDQRMARGLRQAGVDQVLLEVVGDRKTIRDVLHLDAQPRDYYESMRLCREEGLAIAPHLVVGLHYGTIRGEMEALRMVGEVEPAALVIVALDPLRGTAMEAVGPPLAKDVEPLLATARGFFEGVPLALGCARPPGPDKPRLEWAALDLGFDVIAFPDERTVAHAKESGLEVCFSELCCSLSATDEALSAEMLAASLAQRSELGGSHGVSGSIVPG